MNSIMIRSALKAAAVLCLLWAVVSFVQHWRSLTLHRTKPSASDRTRLAALLSMTDDSEMELVRFDFQYQHGMGDHGGAMAAAVRRREESPPWEELLKPWKRANHSVMSGLAGRSFVPWVKEAVDSDRNQEELYHEDYPLYTREVSYYNAWRTNETATALAYPVTCEAFFLPGDANKLYILADGNLFLGDHTIAFATDANTTQTEVTP